MSTPLLQTKLYIPRLRSDYVPRQRLIQHLHESRNSRLVLLSAPAGYGKTTLLSEWVSQGDLQPAWVSLDEADNDVQRFLAYVVAALKSIEPEIGRAWADALQAPQRPPLDELLTLLLNDLATSDRQLILILDDYQTINVPAVHDAVTFLLDHLPPNVSLVIATRVDPPLPLAKLRGSGELVELRAADLRFTYDETLVLFNQLTSDELGDELITILESRSEGWAAGLQMIALSLRTQKDVAQFITTLSGGHRYIADYLADEVLNYQPPDVRTFLLKTAVLDRLSGPLCDAVVSCSNSQVILSRLEEENLFLVALDDECTWYRYHHLFADLLRVRLNQKWPDQVRELHQRASTWFADADDFDAAIRHALAAHDIERATDLLAEHADRLWGRGEYVTLLKWLDQLGEEALRTHPLLRIHHVLAVLMTGQFSLALARMEDMERTPNFLSDLSDQDASLLLGMQSAAYAYVAYYQRNAYDMVRYAETALRHLPEEHKTWRGAVAVILGNAQNHKGNTKAASAAFAEAMRIGKGPGGGFLSLTASAHLAINYVYQGALYRAVHLCKAQLSSGHLTGTAAAGTLHAVWGDVLREWNRIDEARRHLRRANDLCKQGSGIAMRVWSYLALVKLYFSEQRFAEADRVLRRIENLSEVPSWVPCDVTVWRARIWIAQDRLGLAAQRLKERGITADDELSFLHLQEHIALARLRIVESAEQSYNAPLAEAVGLLKRLRHFASDSDWTSKLLETQILLALAYAKQGEKDSSLYALREALMLAEPEGFVRIFLDEGPVMINLLRQAAVRRDLGAYANEILLSLEPMPDRSMPLLEPLSDRELEVLSLIAAGLSNSEIGEKLFVTTGTVKVHASNIYSKLGVSGRIQAVAWARELDLL